MSQSIKTATQISWESVNDIIHSDLKVDTSSKTEQDSQEETELVQNTVKKELNQLGIW